MEYTRVFKFIKCLFAFIKIMFLKTIVFYIL
jgi:hypothetical protein